MTVDEKFHLAGILVNEAFPFQRKPKTFLQLVRALSSKGKRIANTISQRNPVDPDIRQDFWKDLGREAISPLWRNV
jgi:hypothetical protein